MNKQAKICLYCQTPNDDSKQQCSHCGMSLAKQSLRDKKTKLFIKAFWGIVLFCALMIYFLPR